MRMLDVLKRPGFILTFVACYTITAFAWWTYAHIRASEKFYRSETQRLEMLCYKATFEVQQAMQEELFRDTNDMHHFLGVNFPELEVVFQLGEEYANPLDQYLIRPKAASYANLKHQVKKEKWMFGLEGLVMVLLLMWGVIWIYRSLQSRISFNRRQNNFMLSITHELKTPLASVKLYLETLLKRQLDKQQTESILKNAVSEVNRLGNLVDNILLASQLESRNFQLLKSEIHLSQVVQHAVETYVHPRNLQQRLVAEIDPEIYIESDTLAIETIVVNLLSNAYKYGPADQPVTIKLSENKGHVELLVSDLGPGISESDKKNLFQKFYRSGDEHTRKTKGTGLGLFIVKNLLHLLHGQIEIKNNTPQGTTFVVTLN